MKIAENRGKACKFIPHRQGGLTLIELLVLVACVCLLVALILPTGTRGPYRAERAQCQNNLKQIGLGFRTWDGDHTNGYPQRVSQKEGGTMGFVSSGNVFPHFQVMSNELNATRLLVCPSDDRKPAESFVALQNGNVSYFLGADAAETMPGMPLAGDRNLLTNNVPVPAGLVLIGTNTTIGWSANMHNLRGNVLLSDGSVQQGTSSTLQSLFQHSGTNVIRLLIP